MEAQHGGAGGGVGRGDVDELVEAAGADHGRINLPRLVGGGHKHDPARRARFQLLEKLADLFRGVVLMGAQRSPRRHHGFELIHKQEGGRVLGSGVEGFADFQSRVVNEGAADLGGKDFLEKVVQFLGELAGDVSFAATRRAK